MSKTNSHIQQSRLAAHGVYPTFVLKHHLASVWSGLEPDHPDWSVVEWLSRLKMMLREEKAGVVGRVPSMDEVGDRGVG
jgi:hypothetical protein